MVYYNTKCDGKTYTQIESKFRTKNNNKKKTILNTTRKKNIKWYLKNLRKEVEAQGWIHR